MTNQDYEIDQINKHLKGATITDTIKSSDDAFGFEVTTPKGKKFNVWVDCDPEGNGPGHLSIEPEKANKKS